MCRDVPGSRIPLALGQYIVTFLLEPAMALSAAHMTWRQITHRVSNEAQTVTRAQRLDIYLPNDDVHD